MSLVELAALLQAVDVRALSGGDVVGVVQGFEQLIRAAQAGQALAVAELDRRSPVHPSPVADELACALVTTRRSAEMLVVRASMATARPAVLAAWAAGDLDARKVDILLTEAVPANPTCTENGSGADAALVAGLAAAPRMTGPQLTRYLRAAVDPDRPGRGRAAAPDRAGRTGQCRCRRAWTGWRGCPRTCPHPRRSWRSR